MSSVASMQSKLEVIGKYKQCQKLKAFQFFEPYPKQREFFNLGNTMPERCLSAGNQFGKSIAASYETALHATGLYPDDWGGARFTKETIGWVSGVSGADVTKGPQKLLLGRKLEGSGMIPEHCIIDKVAARGVPGLLDHVTVKHVSGGTSFIYFKSYEQGREKFQAETIDWAWCDEEPPYDVYFEIKARTTHGQLGYFMLMTYTPIKGFTQLTTDFRENPSQYQVVVNIGLDDVPERVIGNEQKSKMIDSYPEHERPARIQGIPMVGEGLIYQVPDELISIEPFEIPDSFFQINSMDFGLGAHGIFVNLAWDKDDDIIYVTKIFKGQDGMLPETEAVHIKKWGDVPVAYPHDGHKEEKGTGQTMASYYRDAGLPMLPTHATHEEGGFKVWPGIKEINDRMRASRFKVFSHLKDFFDEKRIYHVKNGKIVKANDHVLDAVRIGVMAKRHAKQVNKTKKVFNFNSEF
ncbi:MAG: terminase large subunit domain-containing protein [Candidatus Nezhaarchaeales archaeon]